MVMLVSNIFLNKIFSYKINLDVFDPVFGQVLDVIVRERESFNKNNEIKREPHKIYNLSSLSFFSHEICFYSNKCLNGSSSAISLLSVVSIIEPLAYRLISHCACIGFIFDNLVLISI